MTKIYRILNITAAMLASGVAIPVFAQATSSNDCSQYEKSHPDCFNACVVDILERCDTRGAVVDFESIGISASDFKNAAIALPKHSVRSIVSRFSYLTPELVKKFKPSEAVVHFDDVKAIISETKLKVPGLTFGKLDLEVLDPSIRIELSPMPQQYGFVRTFQDSTESTLNYRYSANCSAATIEIISDDEVKATLPACSSNVVAEDYRFLLPLGYQNHFHAAEVLSSITYTPRPIAVSTESISIEGFYKRIESRIRDRLSAGIREFQTAPILQRFPHSSDVLVLSRAVSARWDSSELRWRFFSTVAQLSEQVETASTASQIADDIIVTVRRMLSTLTGPVELEIVGNHVLSIPLPSTNSNDPVSFSKGRLFLDSTSWASTFRFEDFEFPSNQFRVMRMGGKNTFQIDPIDKKSILQVNLASLSELNRMDFHPQAKEGEVSPLWAWTGNRWTSWSLPPDFLSKVYGGSWSVALPSDPRPPSIPRAPESADIAYLIIDGTLINFSRSQRNEIASVSKCIKDSCKPLNYQTTYGGWLSDLVVRTPRLKLRLDAQDSVSLVTECFPTRLETWGPNPDYSSDALYVFELTREGRRRLGMSRIVWSAYSGNSAKVRQPKNMCVSAKGLYFSR